MPAAACGVRQASRDRLPQSAASGKSKPLRPLLHRTPTGWATRVWAWGGATTVSPRRCMQPQVCEFAWRFHIRARRPDATVARPHLGAPQFRVLRHGLWALGPGPGAGGRAWGIGRVLPLGPWALASLQPGGVTIRLKLVQCVFYVSRVFWKLKSWILMYIAYTN